MTNLILIDTSAWICAFHRTGYDPIKKIVDTALVTDSLLIIDPVIFELSTGAQTQKQWMKLRNELNALKYASVTQHTWNLAADINFKLRRKGIVCPAMDTLIATVAIENDVPLLHHDRHFDMISKANVGLVSFPIGSQNS